MSLFAAVIVACAVCSNPAPVTVDASDTDDDIAMELSAEVRAGGIAVGDGAERVDLFERRFEARFAVRPVATVEVGVGMPLLVRSFSQGDESWTRIEPGDLDLQVSAILYDDPAPLRHTVSMTGLVKLPTGPVAYDPDGAPLPSNLQPGCSSVVPGLGATYALGWDIWSFQFGAALLVPIVVREAPHRGTTFRQTTTVRARPHELLSFVTGFTWLAETVGQDEADSNEESSGGAVGYGSFGVEAGKPGTLVAMLGVDVPAVEALRGAQDPTPIGFVRVAVGWDAPRP